MVLNPGSADPLESVSQFQAGCESLAKAGISVIFVFLFTRWRSNNEKLSNNVTNSYSVRRLKNYFLIIFNYSIYIEKGAGREGHVPRGGVVV